MQRIHLTRTFLLLALCLGACQPVAPPTPGGSASSGDGNQAAAGSTSSTVGGSTADGNGTDNPNGPAAAAYLAAADLPFDILMQHNDQARTGAILTETLLTPAKVGNTKTFGQVARLQVDGDVYAQPLFVKHAPLKSGSKNLLIVATEHNSVYAFDTNNLAGAPVWQVNLGPAMPMTDFPGETNFSKEIGITGTPAIDPNTGTIYLVSAQRTLSADGNKVFSHWVHAISMEDGNERAGSPVQLTATVQGTGTESQNGNVSFDSSISLQRTAMLLYRGQIFFGASAHGYNYVYHGWFFGYDATTLKQTSVFNTTSDAAQGGVWMSGEGPSVDGNGFMYVTTANGLNADPNTQHQESLLKFTVDANGFALNDWFQASNWLAMDTNDKDFGTTGSLMVPNTHMAVSGDKSGNLYFLDTRHLNHMQTDDSQALSKLAMGNGTGFYGSPVYYAGSKGPKVYAWAALDTLRAYSVSERQGPTAAADSAKLSGNFSMPGGVLSISANANDATSGIVWATATQGGNASGQQEPGTLYAFSADDLTNVLFSSDWTPDRDTLGTLGKFCAPTVADGYVFMATQSNAVAVYGLLSTGQP